MRKEINMKALAALAVAVLAISGCKKENEAIGHEPGTTIGFSASTEWENKEQTRTEYSGKDENNDLMHVGSEYERIDWVAGSDRIRVLCDAATGGAVLSGKGNDYVLGTPVAENQLSKADISPVGGDGLEWGEGDHYFYAFYPAPGTESNYAFTRYNPVNEVDAKITSETGNKAKVTAIVPSVQEAVRETNTRNFKPNMNTAYMFAAKKVNASDASGSVSLAFDPLVTTLEFTLKKAANVLDITEPLTRAELVSSSTALAGTFTATLSTDAAPVITTTGTPVSKITIDLPGEGISLSDDPLKITFLALPVDQTDMSLVLSFGADKSLKRTLALKDNGTPITVDACKKAYFYNVPVPGGTWVYTLDVTGGITAPVPQAGGNVAYLVKSFKENTFNHEKAPVAWTTQYSENDGDWKTDCPVWLQSFTRSGTGSVEGVSDSATLPVNNTPTVWEGSTTPVASSQASARDLSCYDIYGNKTGGVEGTTPYNTANCYVVGAPGWYRIPCVYGNAIKNGADNPSSYTGPASGETLMTGGFRNHADAQITKPWIKDNGVTIDGASLVWQDHKNLITAVNYDSDYLYFYVDPGNIFQGNALLAVKSGDTIVWSWHIWVMDRPETRLVTKLVYSHPNPTNHSIVDPTPVLPMDLGFCDTALGASAFRTVRVKFIQEGTGLEKVVTISQLGSVGFNVTYYEFGRKDPMPPGNINYDSATSGSFPEKTLYDINGSTITRPAGNNHSQTVGYSIQNPFTYIYGSDTQYTSDWTSRQDNLWNTNVTSSAAEYDWSNSPTTTPERGEMAPDLIVCKTIYDPCPPGFKLPGKNTFSGFSMTGRNIPSPESGLSESPTPLTDEDMSVEDIDAFDTALGLNFYLDPGDHSKGTIFMPRTGSRSHWNGNLNGVETWADKTAATPIGPFFVSYLTFAKYYIKPHWITFRCGGLPARPVADN